MKSVGHRGFESRTFPECGIIGMYVYILVNEALNHRVQGGCKVALKVVGEKSDKKVEATISYAQGRTGRSNAAWKQSDRRGCARGKRAMSRDSSVCKIYFNVAPSIDGTVASPGKTQSEVE